MHQSVNGMPMDQCSSTVSDIEFNGRTNLEFSPTVPIRILDYLIEDEFIYIISSPYVVTKIDHNMQIEWIQQMSSTDRDYKNPTISQHVGDELILFVSDNIFFINKTNGDVLQVTELMGWNLVGVAKFEEPIYDYIFYSASTGGQTYMIKSSFEVPNTHTAYPIAGSQDHFTMVVDILHGNTNETGLAVFNNRIVYFDVILPLVTKSHDYVLTTGVDDLNYPRIAYDNTRTTVCALNAADSYNAYIIDFNSSGAIDSIYSIPETFDLIYDCVLNPEHDQLEIVFEDRYARFDYETNNYYLYQLINTVYTHFRFIYLTDRYYYLYCDSNEEMMYIQRQDIGYETTDNTSPLYEFLKTFSNTPATSVSVYTDTPAASMTSSDISSDMTTISVTLSAFTGYVYSYDSDLPPYAVDDQHMTTSDPVLFAQSSYTDVNIGDMICSYSATNDLELEVVSIDGDDDHWLSIDQTTGNLIGIAKNKNKEYSVIFAAVHDTYSIEFELDLTINKCNDPNCVVCSGSPVCIECDDGYVLDELKDRCDVYVYKDLRKAGLVTWIVTLTFAIFTALVGFCCSKVSFQNMFAVIEYYQFLLAFTILKATFNNSVHDYLYYFKAFTLNFNFLEYDTDFVDAPQTNPGLERLELNSISVGCNYIYLIILYGLVGLLHTIVYLVFAFSKTFEQMQAHERAKLISPTYKGTSRIRFKIRLYQFFRSDFYVMAYFIFFLFVFMNIVNEIKENDSGNTRLTLSYVFSVIVLTIMVVTGGYFFDIIRRSTLKSRTGPYRVVLNRLRNTMSAELYYVYYIVRRIIIGIALIVASDRYIQYASFMAVNILHCGYLIISMPFDNVGDSIIHIIIDLNLISISFVYSYFIGDEDYRTISYDKVEYYGYIICYIIMGYNIILCCALLITALVTMKKTCCKGSKRSKDKYRDKSEHPLDEHRDASSNIDNTNIEVKRGVYGAKEGYFGKEDYSGKGIGKLEEHKKRHFNRSEEFEDEKENNYRYPDTSLLYIRQKPKKSKLKRIWEQLERNENYLDRQSNNSF